MDQRFERLADLLVGYSLSLRAGDKVLIEAIEIPNPFTQALIRAVACAGAHPVVLLKNLQVQRELLLAASPEQLEIMAASEMAAMDRVDAYVGLRGSANVSELSDVPAEKMRLYDRFIWRPVHIDNRVRRTRWVVLRWPSPSMAQLSSMSTEAFEEYYFRVCTLDYARMSEAMDPLVQLMDQTDRVRLVSPTTDISFSIKGIPSIKCDGKRNIPDGEVYTAPVLESVNGTIEYNVPTVYQGVSHEAIRFVVRDGKIVEATSSNPEHLQSILDSDSGARFFGEFAIGLNPHITKPMKDILFDEKISGSIHLTPGNAYDHASNGNKSQVHWDLVLMMDPSAGGGEIWFDDVLIRKDGRFTLPGLAQLNPDRLS